jgi:tetratricopeptide (TPR) repeat protein
MKGGFKWVDIEDVISSIRVYPFSDKSGRKRSIMMNQFYAQSWLYVAYLQANTQLNKRLGNYLDLINSGTEPVEAFEEGFGIKAKDFHKAAKKYFQSNKFSVQQYRPGPDFFKVKVSRKKLSVGEVNMQMALGQRNFLGNKSTLSSYVKKIGSYEKEFGQTSQSMNARSLYHQYNKNYDDAISYAQSALGLEQNINSLRILGDIYFHKSHDSKFEELEDTEPRLYTLNEDLEISINHFETVLKYNDEDFTSTDHLLRIYGSSDIPLTSAARNAAVVYEEVHDKGFDPFQTLNLANVYLKSGKLTAACKYFENVKKQAETDPNKDKYSLFNHVELLKPAFEKQCEI